MTDERTPLADAIRMLTQDIWETNKGDHIEDELDQIDALAAKVGDLERVRHDEKSWEGAAWYWFGVHHDTDKPLIAKLEAALGACEEALDALVDRDHLGIGFFQDEDNKPYLSEAQQTLWEAAEEACILNRRAALDQGSGDTATREDAEAEACEPLTQESPEPADPGALGKCETCGEQYSLSHEDTGEAGSGVCPECMRREDAARGSDNEPRWHGDVGPTSEPSP